MNNEIEHAKICLLPHCSKCGKILPKIDVIEREMTMFGKTKVTSTYPEPRECPNCHAIFDFMYCPNKFPIVVSEYFDKLEEAEDVDKISPS